MPTPLDFLKRVLPWPGEGSPGYGNIHWTNKAKYEGMPGKPFKTAEDAISFAQWATQKPADFKDIYFCLSIQTTAGQTIAGKPAAIRRGEFATALKAVWADVDVKEGSGYASTDEALRALDKFCKDSGLPIPTAIVLSGSGGMHLYWISDRVLTVEEWSRYAHGLEAAMVKFGFRHDPVTTDAVRVLRVPGTYNFKHDPPKPAILRLLQDRDLDFGQSKFCDYGIAVPVTATVTASVFPYDPIEFPQKPIPPGGIESLSIGITPEYDDTPLDYLPIFERGGCPFFQQTLVDKGLTNKQPIWMQTALACTFLQNGKRLFHRLSSAYPTYDPADTDKMYDRKVNDRGQRGFGWPSCGAFEASGCTQCATCPLKGSIKSPLNLAVRVAHSPKSSSDCGFKAERICPTERLLKLYQRGAGTETLMTAFNESYAVVRYVSKIVVASINGDEIFTMLPEDFHRMFSNMRFERGKQFVEVSRIWFDWPGRRQYLGRGLIFEPGGTLEIQNDMLNIWRGLGVEPKQGDWSLMRAHILEVVCSGQQKHFDYLIHWMAYAVQHPDKPIGVAVALLGAQGAGKGIVARTFGKFFGKHFAHITHGDQLTGRFNASLGTSCAVFLDEALWAGDKKGEGVLKGLITEPRLQMEAKFRDPIMVENRLRIIVASNNDWAVPTGIGDRRWFVLNVADTYAGTEHRSYWTALYAEIENGGAAAMLYNLLKMDLHGFDVRAVPHTAAKAQQQTLGLQGTVAWLYDVLQEGQIGDAPWDGIGLSVSTDHAYNCYVDFSRRQHAWRPEIKDLWSKKIRDVFGPCIRDTRPTTHKERTRSFEFAPLGDCRRRFALHLGAPNIEWETENETSCEKPVSQSIQGVRQPSQPGARVDAPDSEWEPADGLCDVEWEPTEELDNRVSSTELPQRALDQATADLALVRKQHA